MSRHNPRFSGVKTSGKDLSIAVSLSAHGQERPVPCKIIRLSEVHFDSD